MVGNTCETGGSILHTFRICKYGMVCVGGGGVCVLKPKTRNVYVIGYYTDWCVGFLVRTNHGMLRLVYEWTSDGDWDDEVYVPHNSVKKI